MKTAFTPSAFTRHNGAWLTNHTFIEKDDVVRHFDRHGFVVLKNVLNNEVLAAARDEVNALVDKHAEHLVQTGQEPHGHENEPFETRLHKLYSSRLEIAPDSFREELHLAGMFGMFFNPALLDIVEMFLGGEILLYPNYTVRPKLPGWEEARVPWHQDGALTAQAQGVEDEAVIGLHMVNVWSPLVPATVENGCMQFIPGTHKIGVFPHERKEHLDFEIPERFLEPRLKNALPITLDPGDVVLFHNLLFHQGLPNHSSGIRWSMDWRYQEAGQSTLRKERGHLARSKAHPKFVVTTPQQWASLTFS